MIPRRVAAPTEALISLADAKDHCRIAAGTDHFDGVIADCIDAAMAYLDGYRGILGRCIMAQDWEIDLPCLGRHRLPLPDVTEVSALDAEGEVVACELVQDARGSSVILSAAATVRFTAEMPQELRPSVKRAALLLIGLWFREREAVVTGATPTALPMAVDALLSPVRWSGL